ncbi:MAG: phosphoribosylamine--glycine ligase [Clostridiales bacterium]|jgi:phosphoribosylamine--glycine ligase|nr:phosphoribosylamine--glycine ligase [Clostridiales bacterium]
MKILLVGNGGREHALAWKIAQSPRLTKLYSTRGNCGIAKHAEIIDIAPSDVDGVVGFAVREQMDLVVVAPENPLAAGMIDSLNAAGIRAFGPKKSAAEIEGSKVFAKNLMKKYRIPTAEYAVFDNYDSALKYLQNSAFPIVIKAEGLALGKGVIIAQNLDEGCDALRQIMLDKAFGDAGDRIVIEEFLEGREITVLAFTDGKTIRPMPSSQDHKRVFDNDRGLNTGGMGAFSPSRIYDDGMQEYCMKRIFEPTMRALNAEGREFRGALYFGLIATKSGVKVIEYNARFGDPETQVILPRLKTDIVDIFDAVIDGKLNTQAIQWENSAVCGVIMASGGYPQQYETGKEIIGIDSAEAQGCRVFISGADTDGSGIVRTSGGRVLCVVAQGADLASARALAYKGVGAINFENMHYRKDIAIDASPNEAAAYTEIYNAENK